MHKDNDLFVLNKLKNSETFEEGFKMLVNLYKEKLYWHIRRFVNIHEDADEVLQNTFIKVFKNIKNFRADSKLYTWLYKIASNESLSYIKKNSKIININDIVNQTNLSTNNFNDFSSDEILIILKKAMDKLPEKQKTVFIYRYFDGLSYNDISEIMKISVGGLKANYHHAVKKIEEFIKQHY